jgi:hypothetical protein
MNRNCPVSTIVINGLDVDSDRVQIAGSLMKIQKIGFGFKGLKGGRFLTSGAESGCIRPAWRSAFPAPRTVSVSELRRAEQTFARDSRGINGGNALESEGGKKAAGKDVSPAAREELSETRDR